MPIKTYRPITPTLRFKTSLVNDDLTTDQPHKPLLAVKQRTGGRRNSGQMTIRHHGGGHKKMLRLIDFKRDKFGIPGRVATIEYDPNRSSRIALISYADGEKRYIIQPVGLKVGMTVVSGPDSDILVGNVLPLKNIPSGTTVHNVELRPGKGAQMVRSAGGSAQLVAKEGDYALLKLPSGETRKVLVECMATVGQVGNTDHENVSIGAQIKGLIGILQKVDKLVPFHEFFPKLGFEVRSWVFGELRPIVVVETSFLKGLVIDGRAVNRSYPATSTHLKETAYEKWDWGNSFACRIGLRRARRLAVLHSSGLGHGRQDRCEQAPEVPPL